jgi:hypothetical protein
MQLSQNLGVKTLHREYVANAEKWKMIRKVLDADCKSYLRNVGASESDPEFAKQRQQEYEDGARLFNFTKRTLSGMVGAVMRKYPEITLPPEVEYLLTNCDGAGIGLVQQAQDCLKEVDSLGRAGLLVDAPDSAAANMAEQNAGRLNPRILLYTAENIVNWRETMRGSTKAITMIVLRESYEYVNGDNEFEALTGEQYRVLELVDGKYRQRIFKYDEKGEQDGEIIVIEPKRGNGTSFEYIPFTFIGSDNNDSTVDAAPLYTLADLNIGHYRNSADVEESSFVCSQPTLMIYPGSNMNVTQFKEANPNGIRIGARMGHNLGNGGASELLQAEPSNLAKELMKDKEEQAVRVGAQLITPTIQVTAESARIQRGADTSIMANISNNVSSAYEAAIGWVMEMINVTGEVVFELNTEFFLQMMNAQDRAAWLADINEGAATMRMYWAAMRRADVTNWTDEEIEEDLANQPPAPAPTLDTSVTGEIPPAPEPAPE